MTEEDFTTCGSELIGRSIRVFPVVESTNSLLKAEAETGMAAEGNVILAEYQTTGRGRLDRRWESPPGKSLLLSLLLLSHTSNERLQLIGLMASLCVLDGLCNYFCENVEEPERYTGNILLKWPNDLMIGRRKLCGILCDAGVDRHGKDFIVVGIGLNVNQSLGDFPELLRNIASSLYIMTGKKHSRTSVLKEILASFEGYYRRLQSEGSEWIAPAWLTRAGILGKQIEVKDNRNRIRGICAGLETDGALLLKLEDGTLETIYCGDVA